MTEDLEGEELVPFEEHGITAPPAVPARAEQPLYEVRYPVMPRPTRPAPPDGAGWRERRRHARGARRDARAAHTQARAHAHDVVRGWRHRPTEQLSGLGVVVLVAALALCAWTFWPTRSHPARTTSAPAPTAAGVTPAPPTPTPSAPATGGDTPTPTTLTTPTGRIVEQFLLNWNSYSPLYPAAVDNWIGGFRQLTASSVVETARADADRTWLFATQQLVTVIPQQVTDCTTTDPATYTCTVTRGLWPAGAHSGDTYTTQTVRQQVQVTTTGSPQVTGTRVLNTSTPAPAASTPGPAEGGE